MNEQKVNVFVLGTEYHFLLAMFIIHERFQSSEYLNKLVFLGRRLSHIDRDALPSNVITDTFQVELEKQPVDAVNNRILNGAVKNLFMVNVYRASDTLIVSMAHKSTRVHLMQDGALFYNNIEKSIFKSRIKQTTKIYLSLWKKKVLFTDLLWYGRYMETSNYVHEIWMTNPNEYVGPSTNKKVNLIKYFDSQEIVQKINSYFLKDDNLPPILDGFLIYLSPIIKVKDHVAIEIAKLKALLQHLPLKKILIKLHPNSPDFHLEALKKHFEGHVVRNFVPAEVYISRAKNSVVIGCASTSLFYNNPACQYFGLKAFFQDLGIYAKWKNVNLPSHVRQVESMDNLQKLLDRPESPGA
jgi:hypothetical protein